MPELARTYVEQVEKASQALLATVNDILDFSKLEAGQVRIQPEPTEVVRLCRSGLELFTPQAAAKDLQLRLVLDADADLVALLDGNRLRQVLLNLLSNAVKFTASGSVTLEVAYDAAEERLNLAVRDSGQGIPADKLGALFRRFSQVDGGLSRKHGGTGLGLAICKGLVEAMGGRIGADSCEGEGSRFWVSLPAPPCEKRLEDTTSDAEASLVFAGVSVLVVDDHPANRELARLFLTGAGAEVGEACDGAAAVELAGERPFDAILMDVRMPKLDGRQALQKIRAGAGPNARTPIIAYTADASDQEAERLTALGFDGVVAKPVTAGRLIVGVAEALSVAQSAAAA
jgi:CheY-like chemotaxis protein